MKKNIIIAAGLVSVLAALIFIIGPGGASKDIPGRTPYLVNDYAGVLDSATKQHLESLLKDMRDNRPMHTEVVITTFKSLNGMSFDEFFGKYLRGWWRWPIFERHNRIQVVIIAGEGVMRIGVGVPLSDIITEKMTNEIMARDMLPDFQRGDYATGIRKGAEAIVAALNNSGEKR